MSASKDIKSDCGICHFSSSGHFINRETGDAVYEGMVFVAPVELIFLFISLVGRCVYTEFTVLICFWLVVRLEFVGEERLGIVL